MGRYKLILGVVILTVVIMIFVVVGLAVADCNARTECRTSGGHVEEYKCKKRLSCTTVNNVTTCTPYESCDWRCVKAESE